MGVNDEMLSIGLTDVDYERCLDLIIDKKNNVRDVEWKEICDLYNLPFSYESLRKANGTLFGGYAVAEYYRNKYKDSKFENTSSKNESIDRPMETKINKDGTYSSSKLLTMNEEQSKDVDYILTAHGFDSSCWKLVSARNNIRQVVNKDNDDGVSTLYSSFITVKPCNDLSINKIKEFYKELVDMNISPVVKKKEICKNGYMLEIPIEDVHFGKLSLSEDSVEPYNYNLAKERFSYVVDDVINNVSGLDIEKIIFPIGSDFFHIDNYDSTTTAGTSQSTDLSPQLIFKYGLECLIENIKKLSKVAPVHVFCVNGNHDFLSSYHAICSIDCYFHNDENVFVNTDTSPRKYIEFGNCLIGFSHGDKEKNRIDGTMQIEARESWGRTKYHEFHIGHLHSEHTKETNGLIIRNLSSFTGTDSWHNNSGYVGSVKKCQSFLWDKNSGLKNIIMSVID